MIDSLYNKVILKDIVSTMHQGINTAADKVKYADSGMPIIQAKHFTSGQLELKETKYLSTKDVKKYADKYKPTEGDILFSNIGTVGKSVVVSHCSEFMFAWNVFLMKPKRELVFNQYLQYYLGHLLERNAYERWFTGGTVKFLNKKTIGNFEIPLPPLAEQKKIASVLDAADSLRQKDQQLIEKYTALSQSLFLEMFGDPTINPYQWEIKNLSDICLKITDGTHQSPTFLSSGIPFLLVSNIVDNEIKYQTKKFISEQEYKALTKNTPIEIGDILYTSVGSYGNPAIVKSEEKFCFQRHIAQIKLKHQLVNVNFMHRLLQTPSIKLQADKLARGVAQKTLNLTAIKSLKVIHPPITLQNQFAERIQAIEAQKQQAQASLKKSDDLFNSLLQRAFKGELTASEGIGL